VRRRIRQHLQIIGRVFIVCRRVQAHDFLQKGFGEFVVGNEGVPVDAVEKKVYPDDQKQGGEENQPPDSPMKPISVEYCTSSKRRRRASPFLWT